MGRSKKHYKHCSLTQIRKSKIRAFFETNLYNNNIFKSDKWKSLLLKCLKDPKINVRHLEEWMRAEPWIMENARECAGSILDEEEESEENENEEMAMDDGSSRSNGTCFLNDFETEQKENESSGIPQVVPNGNISPRIDTIESNSSIANDIENETENPIGSNLELIETLGEEIDNVGGIKQFVNPSNINLELDSSISPTDTENENQANTSEEIANIENDSGSTTAELPRFVVVDFVNEDWNTESLEDPLLDSNAPITSDNTESVEMSSQVAHHAENQKQDDDSEGMEVEETTKIDIYKLRNALCSCEKIIRLCQKNDDLRACLPNLLKIFRVLLRTSTKRLLGQPSPEPEVPPPLIHVEDDDE